MDFGKKIYEETKDNCIRKLRRGLDPALERKGARWMRQETIAIHSGWTLAALKKLFYSDQADGRPRGPLLLVTTQRLKINTAVVKVIQFWLRLPRPPWKPAAALGFAPGEQAERPTVGVSFMLSIIRAYRKGGVDARLELSLQDAQPLFPGGF